MKNAKAPTSRPVSLSRIRVFLLDDHPVIRGGLKEIVEREPDMTVCGEAEDPAEALSKIPASKATIVVTDLSLKDSTGLGFVKDLRIRHKNLPAVVFSMHSETLYAERAIRAGARGYVMKQQPIDTLVQAIRIVSGGGVYLSPDVSSRLLNKTVGMASKSQTTVDLLDTLSDRELEVFRLIGTGLGTRRIAEKLFLSVKTIETYREHIKSKLNLQDSSELTQTAIQWLQVHV